MFVNELGSYETPKRHPPIGVVSKNAVAECKTAQRDALNVCKPADRLVKLLDSEQLSLSTVAIPYLTWKLRAKEKRAMAIPSAAYVPI